MYDIVTFGSATQDILIRPEEFSMHDDQVFATGKALCLPFGSRVKADAIAFASGGGGTNAAVTFARQGYHTACVCMLGKDPASASILDELRREGVDGKYSQSHPHGQTAHSVILVGEHGERTILTYKGAGTHWDTRRIPWERLEAKWFYVDSIGDREVLETLIAFAKKHSIHLATNPGGRDLALGLDVLTELWKSFDIVGMNQEEAARLTGIPYDEPERIFRKLDDAIGGIVILTRGTGGALVSDGVRIYSAGIPAGEVVERTGAGDAFHSGFLAEFIRSGSIEKAIQFATANATSVVAQYGAKAGILRKGESSTQSSVPIHTESLK